MVKLWCSASDGIRVPARPAQHVHRRVFQTCDAGRARVYLPSEAGTPDMTIERADADRAGARPYLRRRPSSSVLLFLGLQLGNKAFWPVPFLERFLDRNA